ncbi:MAG TPA: hypothetical protein VFK43_20275, partial [Acidimicrobiales bacterium]|nr:hypothetical protein [Acidimicrobiales bacterium]
MDREGAVGEAPAEQPSSRWLVAALTAALAVPLVVGLAALRRPTWSPVLDLSMTELRLRDVGGSHTPLVGLPGRIGDLATQGSHPGPLSFYVLAPVYRVFGSTAWAMQVAAVASNVAAAGVALWLAGRRGGRRLVLGTGLLLALLTAGYGISPLTEPWNPYLPMLWWFVVLLAVWSVLACDPVAFPVAVAAGSLCAQTHLPYLGLAGGLVVLLTAWQLAHWWRSRRAGEPLAGTRWLAAGLALGVVLWLPPVLDQLSPPAGEPGNAELIVDTILTPEEDPVGPGEALDVALRHLDPVPFVDPGDGGIDGGDGALLEASFGGGNAVRGALLLVAWLAAAAWSFVHRTDDAAARSRWWLHAVVAAALVLGLFNISRIYGKVWYYLTLWAWGTTAILVLATGLTLAALAGRRVAGTAIERQPMRRAGAVAAVAATALVLGWFA